MLSKIQIAPSILSANMAQLGKEVEDLAVAGANFVHIDIMDGHFVPNLTFGADIVRAIRPYTNLPFDVHLMIDNPQKYINAFIDAGANSLTLHKETSSDLKQLLIYIRQKGLRTGICVKPATPIKEIYPYLDLIDLVLIMSVEPGFGGQTFIPEVLHKITQTKEICTNRPILVEVDGGINDKTADLAVQAGADILVSGSYIFHASNKARAIATLKGIHTND